MTDHQSAVHLLAIPSDDPRSKLSMKRGISYWRGMRVLSARLSIVICAPARPTQRQGQSLKTAMLSASQQIHTGASPTA